jgi:hypothetical protein
MEPNIIPKNAVEQLWIQRRQYQRHVFIETRTYYRDDVGAWQPTKKGVTMCPDLWDNVKNLREGGGDAALVKSSYPLVGN